MCKKRICACNVATVTTEMTSKERLIHGIEDLLTFIKVDSELNEEECYFEGSKLHDWGYLHNQLQNGKKLKLELGELNLTPVKEAFKRKNGPNR